MVNEMESVLVHNGSIQAKVQESLTTNTAKLLGFIVPAFLLNLLTCRGTTLYNDHTESLVPLACEEGGNGSKC